MRYALFAFVLLLAACGDGMSRGIVITGDGKVGANNARNQRENCQDALAEAIVDELGRGWNAQVAIDEDPRWIEDRLSRPSDVSSDGYWRWDRITAAIVIAPPAGQTLAADRQERLLAESKTYLMSRLAKRDPALVAATLSLGVSAATIAPAPGPTIRPPPGQRTYVVQPGDTLADVSTAFYGTPQHWRLIAEANPGGTAPGQTVVIPALPAAPTPAPAPAP